ncbi:hypothetical protein A6F68_01187 [Tsuneonella dongtanensis]|uniref:DUF4129 domain-containing protein n=1 Tax=Tsuneonella dongtanensis TaxID=692370 RepID=A0A1B2ACC8_9SPHN|nr:hypothetical protein [Tsuneonella dongtanensis]ANY19705.1 hypothetical protein A6F68_01187 [Tsuneonella dongtanensis]
MTSTGAGDIADAGKAWEAVRADDTIQFAPLPVRPEKPPEPPGWLEALFRWLGEMLEPVGRAFGMSWPVFKWVLLAIGIALALLLVWRMVAPALGWRPQRRAEIDDAGWTPEAAAALALLEDADRLAAEGRYDEATHLLLQRSVGQIAEARPDLVEPATTARELSTIAALPEGARTAFGVIAARVERSLFALRALGVDDWQAARAAYAEFALAPIARAQP